jgi:hypothetical protein
LYFRQKISLAIMTSSPTQHDLTVVSVLTGNHVWTADDFGCKKNEVSVSVFTPLMVFHYSRDLPTVAAAGRFVFRGYKI